MKLVTITLITLLNLSTFVYDTATSNQEIVGEYLAYKVVHDPADGTGWALSERFERKLILQEDQTYKEINSSFETFDAADYEGEWTVKNDTLLLTPKGYLTYKDGKYRPGIMNYAHNKEFPTNKLLILSDNELQILEEGFMEGEILTRIAFATPRSQEFSLSDTCVKAGSSLELREVKFEFNKANFIDQEQPQLDSLLFFLGTNHTAVVEIGIHTGLRGTASHNLDLSRQRASYITKFLQTQGIDTLRFVAIGFGETIPIIESEELDEQLAIEGCGSNLLSNQRVTILIKENECNSGSAGGTD